MTYGVASLSYHTGYIRFITFYLDGRVRRGRAHEAGKRIGLCIFACLKRAFEALARVFFFLPFYVA